MAVLNRKLPNALELFLRHACSLHKSLINDKVGCVDKCMQTITLRQKFFCSFFLDHEVDFYFKNPNPEIRNQMLMAVCFKTQIFLSTQHLDYSMSTSGTDASSDRSTN